MGPPTASQSDLQTLIKYFNAHPSGRYHQALLQDVENRCPKPVYDLAEVSTKLGLDLEFCKQFQDCTCFPRPLQDVISFQQTWTPLPSPAFTASEHSRIVLLSHACLSLLIAFNLSASGLRTFVSEKKEKMGSSRSSVMHRLHLDMSQYLPHCKHIPGHHLMSSLKREASCFYPGGTQVLDHRACWVRAWERLRLCEEERALSLSLLFSGNKQHREL